MTIEKVIIRKIKDDDYESCMELLRDFTKESIFTNQYPGQPDKDKKKSCEMYKDKFRCFLGAFVNSKLIGICDFFVKWPNHPWSGKNCEFGLCLLKAYTETNVGRLLMLKLEEEARKKGMHRLYSCVRVKDLCGINLYLSLGYSIDGLAKEVAFINGKWYDEYYISKLLM